MNEAATATCCWRAHAARSVLQRVLSQDRLLSPFLVRSPHNLPGSRLRVVGLDLRLPAGVEAFAAWLAKEVPHLDLIVNNACQTIRRPASYYAHLLPGEEAGQRAMLEAAAAAGGAVAADGATVLVPVPVAVDPIPRTAEAPAMGTATGTASGTATGTAPDAMLSLAPPAQGPLASSLASPGLSGGSPAATAADLSALEVTSEDVALGSGAVPGAQEAALPSGLTDAHGQQLDLRAKNSWLLKLGEVETPEAVEVLAINALAPFILNSRLRPLLEKSPFPDRHVINVSAMEGNVLPRTTDTPPVIRHL